MKFSPRARLVKTRIWAVAVSATAVALVAACGSGGTSSSSTSSTPSSSSSSSSSTSTSAGSFPAALVAAATTEAKADAGGKKIGGSISMIDQLGGFEQTIFENSFKPFEQATGITINFTASQDYQQILQTRVSAGDPPDVVNDNGSGNMASFEKKGLLVPLGNFLNTAKLDAQYNPGVLQALSVNGKLYGLMAEYSPQMIFINAKTYSGADPITSWSNLVSYSDQLAKSGKTPWCAAWSASAQTGWPAAYFIEEIFAKTYGASALTQWGDGKIPFTSPEVKASFEKFGQIFAQSNLISGGVSGALSKPIAQGPVGLYTNPQQCQMFAWGIYAAGIAESQNQSLKPVTNINFFPIPAVNPQYANNEQASGWDLYAFHNTPQVQALVKYYASAAYQSLLASTGEWIVPNKDVTNYPNALLTKASKQLVDASAVGFGPYFGQTTAAKTAFLKAITSYVQNPGSLAQDLATAQATVQSSGR